MERYTFYMDNNIICINDSHLPQLAECGVLSASEDFLHMDRTADFNVMIYVTDGVMYVTEDGHDFEIAAGELLFLKNGLRHFGKRETLRGTRWFYAHFYLNENADGNALALPKKVCGLSDGSHEEKLRKLHEYFHGSDPFKEFRRNVMFCDFLIGLVSETAPHRESLSDRICTFLEAQAETAFSKELVEQSFFLSYSHMAAAFRKEKGMSMGQYHNSVKMKKACSLLRSTLMPVGEIAGQLGFSDTLYFSRKFHGFAGCSPSDYRKKAQREY